jgi:CRP-like cAMP-binding protein
MISPETLRFYHLFAHQDVKMLEKIAMLAKEKEVEPGYQLFFEGEEAKVLYLVTSGAVVLTMNMPEEGVHNVVELEPLKKDEVVGWSSIVQPHIYQMGAYAKIKSNLIIFDGEQLRNLFDENPVFGYYFMQKLSETIGERLVSKCIQLLSLTE